MTTHKLTQNEFLVKAKSIHGDKYDYSLTQYVNCRSSISVICPKHGMFKHLAKTHLGGRGCPKCGNGMIDQKEFIKLAKQKHNNKYCYSNTTYKNKKTKISIICNKHGEFQQTPEKHLTGQGCPYCNRSELSGSNKTTQDQFIKLCIKIHGNKYDYTNTKFINWKTKVKIVCKKHGIFIQDPSAHAHNKCGCPSCGFNTSISGNLWIKSFNNKDIIPENVMLIDNKRFKVDGFNPVTNTIYEYFGSYWHGHPNRFDSKDIHPIRKISYGELYQETLHRIKYFKKNGFKVVYQWGR